MGELTSRVGEQVSRLANAVRTGVEAGVSAYQPVLDNAPQFDTGSGDRPSHHQPDGSPPLDEHLRDHLYNDSSPIPAGRTYHGRGPDALATYDEGRAIAPIDGTFVLHSAGDATGQDVDHFRLLTADTAALLGADPKYHPGDTVLLTFPADERTRGAIANGVDAPVTAVPEGHDLFVGERGELLAVAPDGQAALPPAEWPVTRPGDTTESVTGRYGD